MTRREFDLTDVDALLAAVILHDHEPTRDEVRVLALDNQRLRQQLVDADHATRTAKARASIAELALVTAVLRAQRLSTDDDDSDYDHRHRGVH